MIIFIGLVVFAIAAIVVFIILEERGRPEVAVILAVALVVIDALAYQSQGAVPRGILHPTILGHDYRVPDLLIPLALSARLAVRGLPRRVTGPGLLWFGFFGAFAFAAFVGIANAHSSTLVIFQTKFVIEAGGMAILVAGVPIETWTSPAFVGKAAWTLGLVSVVPIAMGALNHTVAVPLLSRASLGRLGADAATVLLSLAFLLILVEVCSDAPRRSVLFWCGLMIISPVFTGQRAALVGMVVALLCGVVVLVGRPWRRRSRTRLTHLLPLVAVFVVPLGTAAVLNTQSSLSAADLPVVGNLDTRFTGTAKTQSADIRLTVWALGRHLAEERPAFGWGLGQDFSIFQNNGSEDPFTGGDFHNIAIDLAVTTGLTGLGMFAIAFGASMWSAFMTWRDARRSTVAAIALAAGILMLQLVVKGLFESVFQKYRLAIIFGLLIGLVAATSQAVESEVAETETREPTWT